MPSVSRGLVVEKILVSVNEAGIVAANLYLPLVLFGYRLFDLFVKGLVDMPPG